MTGRLGVLPAILLLSACARREPLPDLGAVPDFTLTDQTGALFHGSSLRGHVWIADFVYTNCPGPCPLMSQRMNRIQTRTASGSSVRLVSFSVDPARDTPPVLTRYAQRFAASPARWTFLTGNPATLEMLDREAFKLGDLNAAMNHSTRFVLVDARGRIRGYYTMSDADMVDHIVRDAMQLDKENS